MTGDEGDKLFKAGWDAGAQSARDEVNRARRPCVCGHAYAHHSRSRRANCLWKTCGCPLYLTGMDA